MKEAFGDIWELADDIATDVAIGVTTNGFVRKDGKAVMGRGVAKEAAERHPWLPENLGIRLRNEGNHVYFWGADYNLVTGKSTYLITFPVKPEYGPRGEQGWKAKADIQLIQRSAIELMAYPHWILPPTILLPRPGCGNGGLKWEEVKPVIEDILDDRVTVVTWNP